MNNDRFMGGNNNGGGGQYAVHLRGMPYDCGESDVQQFFAPLKVVNCQVFYNNNGKWLISLVGQSFNQLYFPHDHNRTSHRRS